MQQDSEELTCKESPVATEANIEEVQIHLDSEAADRTDEDGQSTG